MVKLSDWNIQFCSFYSSVFFQAETYHPYILSQRAAKLRRSTGNWALFSAHDEVELSQSDLLNSLSRPVTMIFTEPFLLAINIYTSFVYGLLYLLLGAYPIIFAEGYKMSGGVSQLPYLSIFLGMVASIALSVFYFEPRLNRQVARNNGKTVPEYRLPAMIAGGITLPIGIFWLSWTGNYPQHIHWLAPTFAGLFIGHGIYAIFLTSVNYMIDCYLPVSASAIACNTFMRSSFGAAFPLFAPAMFNNLGINWAGTLIGCLAVVLIPGPILFSILRKQTQANVKVPIKLSMPNMRLPTNEP